MTIGTIREQTEANQGDTVDLRAFLYDSEDQPIDAADLASVQFTISRPNQTQDVIAGTISTDGSGFLRYANTSVLGLYVWVARFTFVNGEIKSRRDEFNVSDPLYVPPTTRKSKIADEVWMRIEDCFDSELGGPWLRDMTLAYFDQTKVEKFIAEGLIFINGWPPVTNFDLDTFTTRVPDPDPALPPGTMRDDPDQILIIQATLLAVIRHLMRSYVEQPNPVGANIVWQNKRDYLERWGQIYQIEEAYFRQVVALWKRQFFNYGAGALLVHSKAGRLGYGSGYRARNAQRGF